MRFEDAALKQFNASWMTLSYKKSNLTKLASILLRVPQIPLPFSIAKGSTPTAEASALLLFLALNKIAKLHLKGLCHGFLASL